MSLPLVVATACFLRNNGKTLLVDYTHHPHPIHAGKYAAPGEKIAERDKNLEEGAKREVLEETNILANRLVYRGTVTFLNEKRTIKGKPMKSNWEVHFYDCCDFDASNAGCNKGALAWIEDGRVSELPLHEGDKTVWEWMRDYLEFRGEIVYEGEKLTSASLTYQVASSAKS